MKEQDKVLFAKLLIKITVVMILISFALKLLGFNFFEADESNKLFLLIANIMDNYKRYEIKLFFNIIFLLIQSFVFFRLSCKNQNKNTYYISSILITIITIFSQKLLYNFLWDTYPHSVQSIYAIYTFIL